jgi:hypothetical protein
VFIIHERNDVVLMAHARCVRFVCGTCVCIGFISGLVAAENGSRVADLKDAYQV